MFVLGVLGAEIERYELKQGTLVHRDKKIATEIATPL
jgi:hypothetical protein